MGTVQHIPIVLVAFVVMHGTAPVLFISSCPCRELGAGRSFPTGNPALTTSTNPTSS